VTRTRQSKAAIDTYFVTHTNHYVFGQIILLFIVFVIIRSVVFVLITVVQVRSDDLFSRVDPVFIRLDFRVSREQGASCVSRGFRRGRCRIAGILVSELCQLVIFGDLSCVKLAIRIKGFDILFIFTFLVELFIIIFRKLE
jgi:hypothetical protein